MPHRAHYSSVTSTDLSLLKVDGKKDDSMHFKEGHLKQLKCLCAQIKWPILF